MNAQSQRLEPRDQRFVLVVRQRAQRVEHDRLRAALERADGGRVLEAQRLPAPGPEHGQRVVPGVEAFDHGALRVAQGAVADQRVQHVVADDGAPVAM